MTRLVRSLPHHAFTRVILIRGTVVWIAVRIAMLLGGGLAPSFLGPWNVDRGPLWAGLVSSGVVALVTALVRLDLARLNERLFLANLGVRTTVLTSLAAVPPLLFEVALATLIASGLAAPIGAR